MSRERSIARAPQTSTGKQGEILLERPDVNQQAGFVVVPQFPPDHPKATIPRSPSGSSGTYLVTFVLAIPGKNTFKADLNIPDLMDSGESLLLVAVGTNIEVVLWNQQGQFCKVIFSPNARGEIAKAQIRVSALSLDDAERNAYSLVLPLLSLWSYHYDVAMDIAGYEVLEEQTEVVKCVFSLLGKAKLFDVSQPDPTSVSRPEVRSILAAYREALCSANIFHQFLCFYKVIEGIRALRAERGKREGEIGCSFTAPEQFPTDAIFISNLDPYVAHHFRRYRGRKFTRVVGEFRDILRNAVAHLNPGAESLEVDRYKDVLRCQRAVPIIRYIARVMLQNEITADRGQTLQTKNNASNTRLANMPGPTP